LISPDELTKNLPLAIGASAIIHEQKMTPNENGARDEMEKCQDESEIYVEIVN